MRIALIGYGKMGREIEKVALERGHTIALIIDSHNLFDLNTEKLKGIDIAFEFTSPASAADNTIICLKNGVSVVSGTTGWLERMPEAIHACKKGDCSFIHASNFSLGVNIFFRINSMLGKIMSKNSSYRAEIEEIHHIHKLDAPSGTAITLAKIISDSHKGYNGWRAEDESDSEKIQVKSIREGEVPGTHTVSWESKTDRIELKHEAFTRAGFSLGAVVAAEYIAGKKGSFTMDQVLGF